MSEELLPLCNSNNAPHSGAPKTFFLSLPLSLRRGCLSARANRFMLPSVFTGGSTHFYGATLITTWLPVLGDWWKINLRHACGSPLKYAWNIFLYLIFSIQCYFIWHPFLLCYSPFFHAGIHSSSQLSTDFIMILFTSAVQSLMRVLTKSRSATNLYFMLPDNATPFYALLLSITLCHGLFASSHYTWKHSWWIIY